ncbi:MAG: MMPL family transporter [Candidatus Heimdallarchaeaceae archaeon]
MTFIDKYHKFLEKYKIIVIVIWCVILGFSVWLGPKFLDATSSSFEPPNGSPSQLAEEVLEAEFPEFANETSIVILIRMKEENVSVINTEVEAFCQNVTDITNEYSDQTIIISVLNYYILNDLGFITAAGSFVAESGKSMLFVIDLKYEGANSLINDFIYYLRDNIASMENEDNEFDAFVTGFRVMYLDMKEVTEEDLALMDMIVIPIAMLVLAFVLRSLKLMILPILSMGISILTSFLIMYPIALTTNIFSFVPSIMMSLVIALSIDYSLFLLTRYREEILKHNDNSEATKKMSKHAGHTITLSGLTLAITFLGLIFFPLELLSTIGLGAAICIVSTLIVNLTLTPALLLTFGKFFSKLKWYRKSKGIKEGEFEDYKKMDLANQAKSIWYKISKFSTKYALVVILVIVVITIPISIQVFKFQRSIDFNQILPRGVDSREAYNAMQEDFAPGQVMPFYIIIQTNETNGLNTPSFFYTAKDLIHDLANETAVYNESFISIVRIDENELPFFSSMQDLLDPLNTGEFAVIYRTIYNKYTNEENSTTLMEVQTPFDPWGDDAESWIKQTRVILERYEEQTGYKLYLAGGSTVMVDAIDKVYELFPLMISITLIVVYILIGIMFKSVFIPLRLIFTIGITLSFIYGLGVLVFETSFLNNVFSPLQDVHAFYWLVPIMAFSILIGLGLDYDIFLLSRISEYRDKGYTEKASIHKGLYKTGNIISFAGIIMAIAFSGLLLSKEMVLNQFGFMLCIAVLVDTFIVRTILVPAIMSVAEKWNWWPSKKPEPIKDENHVEE